MPGLSTGLASFTYGGSTTTGLVSVSYSTQTDMVETTRITDARRTYLTGQGTTTISGEIYYDQGDACAALLETDSIAPTSKSFAIVFTTNMGLSGNCFVTSFQVTANSGETIRASFELQTTGTVTIT